MLTCRLNPLYNALRPKQKSKTHKRTLNPTFDETFKVVFDAGDMRAGDEKRLAVQVWDWDRPVKIIEFEFELSSPPPSSETT